MQCVLVTGGSGLMGSALRLISGAELKYRFVFMSSRDCDLTDYESTLRYFNAFRPTFTVRTTTSTWTMRT